MRKLLIAALLVAGVSLSAGVLAQDAAAPKAATKTAQAAPAPTAKKSMAHHHHAHKAMKKTADSKPAGK